MFGSLFLSEKFFSIAKYINAGFLKKTLSVFSKKLDDNFPNIWSNTPQCIDYDRNIIQRSSWLCTDSEEAYKSCGHPIYDEDSIIYKLNKHGFRVFDTPTNNLKIACFGCSQTFGSALPDDHTWVYKLNEKLGFDRYTCYNYGLQGASNDTISRLVYSLIQTKKPDAVVCFFPDIFRVEYYNMGKKDGDILNFWPRVIHVNKAISKAEYNAYTTITNEYNAFFNFIKNFKLIETICKLHNIPFVWYTWSLAVVGLDGNIITRYLNSDSLIKSDGSLVDLLKDYPECWKDLARDNIHFGPVFNNLLAEELKKLLLKKL
jgi:hypothetical protein